MEPVSIGSGARYQSQPDDSREHCGHLHLSGYADSSERLYGYGYDLSNGRSGSIVRGDRGIRSVDLLRRRLGEIAGCSCRRQLSLVKVAHAAFDASIEYQFVHLGYAEWHLFRYRSDGERMFLSQHCSGNGDGQSLAGDHDHRRYHRLQR